MKQLLSHALSKCDTSMTHVSLINAVMFNNLAQDDFDLNQQYFMSLEQEET